MSVCVQRETTVRVKVDIFLLDEARVDVLQVKLVEKLVSDGAMRQLKM